MDIEINKALEDIAFEIEEHGISGEIDVMALAKQRVHNQSVLSKIENLRSEYLATVAIHPDTLYRMESMYFQQELCKQDELSRKTFITTEQRELTMKYLGELSQLLMQLC